MLEWLAASLSREELIVLLIGATSGVLGGVGVAREYGRGAWWDSIALALIIPGLACTALALYHALSGHAWWDLPGIVGELATKLMAYARYSYVADLLCLVGCLLGGWAARVVAG